jgi:hypothetical protein
MNDTIDEVTPEQKARLLFHAIDDELAAGTKHYRPSDGKLLKTAREVLDTLVDEGVVKLEAPTKR